MATRSRTKSTESAQPELWPTEVPEPFRKSVAILHNKPKTSLSLLQRKLLNGLVKFAVENRPGPDDWWEIGLKQLEADVGFDSKNREYIKESARALMHIVFEWDVVPTKASKSPLWKASVMFPDLELDSYRLRFKVSSHIRETMLNPDVYALIDMAVVRRFRRAAAMPIWEFCVRYERLEMTAAVAWEVFRDMVLGDGAESRTYAEYKYFKSKVLDPCIAEINTSTDHHIELVVTKVGRSVSKIAFRVQRRTHAAELVETSPEDQELVSELVRFGLPQAEAKKTRSQHQPSEIRAALEYTKKRLADKKQGPIEKPLAYFRNALKNGYAGAVASAEEAKPVRKKAQSAIDLREAVLVVREAEAKVHFHEQRPEDQAKLIESYNAQQSMKVLHVTKRVTKSAEAAFFRWLALDLWGEPTSEDMLAHAQRMLEERSTA